jgi:ribosomal protein S17E
MDMKQQLEEIRAQAGAALHNARTTGELEELRIRYLGKKGELTALLKQMGSLSAEERPVMGQLANQVRADIESELALRAKELEAEALEAQLQAEALDVTIPGKRYERGHKHPMSIVLDEVKETIVNAYRIKSKRSRNKIAQMMDEETWMSAKKAVAEGFADGILYADDASPDPSVQDSFMLSRMAIQNSLSTSAKHYIEQYQELLKGKTEANQAPPKEDRQNEAVLSRLRQVQNNRNRVR